MIVDEFVNCEDTSYSSMIALRKKAWIQGRAMKENAWNELTEHTRIIAIQNLKRKAGITTKSRNPADILSEHEKRYGKVW